MGTVQTNAMSKQGSSVHSIQTAKPLPPRYLLPPQPKTTFPPAPGQDLNNAVAVGDSGKQFQTVADIDR